MMNFTAVESLIIAIDMKQVVVNRYDALSTYLLLYDVCEYYG